MGSYIRPWRTKLGVVTLIIALGYLTGCDPVRTRSQTVTMTIVDRESNTPIAGAKVQLKDAWIPPDSPYLNPEESKQIWENAAWYESVSNTEGQVRVDIISTAIDGTRGNTPPAERDVSGRRFLIKITPPNGSSDIAEMAMSSKTSSETETCVIQINEIGHQKYLDIRHSSRR